MEGYVPMEPHNRGRNGETIQMDPVIYTNTDYDYDVPVEEDDEDDNVYLALPYRSGMARHRTMIQRNPQAQPQRPPAENVTPKSPKKVGLKDRNKKFISSLKNKDVSTVQKELDDDPTLTMYTDDQGISALSEAARAGPVLLDAFLQKIKERRRLAVWIEHALLYAISANNCESVEYLLDKRDKLMESETRSHPAPPPGKVGKVKNAAKNLGFVTWSDRHKTQSHFPADLEDAEFPIYLTPIILAAKLHRGEILKLLLTKPYTSEIHPLTATCPLGGTDDCEICREQRVFKSKRKVEESRRLVEIYKALSSPTYILMSGVADPVLEVFELSREMRGLAIEDAPFKSEYDAIGQSCRRFACDLLDLCRSTEEIETLLSIEDGIKKVNASPQSVEFQRIIVAVSFGQKEFLTHPSCQQVLQRKWYEGLPNWCCETEHRGLGFVAYIFLWCLCWPFACILFMLKLCPWAIRFMKHPINKFISDTISFAWFLAFLIIECNNNREKQKASDIFKPVEILIIIWTLGMLARQMKMIWRHRRSCRCVSLAAATREWRWYEMVLLSSFVLWIILKVIGICIAYAEGTQDEPRYKWDQYDVILISEGFFSLGVLLSFIKLVGLFKASSSLGPLQISLKLMLNDILRFLLIFFITMTGFVMALTNIYSHYEGHVRIDEQGEMANQTEHLTKWRNTYKTLFWALFGYGEYSVADVVVGNFGMDGEDGANPTNSTNATMVATTVGSSSDDVVKHKATEFYGYVLFGTYHIVVIIVLINMLIAMMARSYEVIACNSDMEWKYARTKLRMIYFSEVGSLPPPFNILILGSVMKCCLRCCGKCCECCRDRYESNPIPPKGNYASLIGKLGKRYLSRQAKMLKEQQQQQNLSDEELKRIGSIVADQKSRISHA